MTTVLTVVAILIAVVLISMALSLRIIKQYEKGVLFRFGRVLRASPSPWRVPPP